MILFSNIIKVVTQLPSSNPQQLLGLRRKMRLNGLKNGRGTRSTTMSQTVSCVLTKCGIQPSWPASIHLGQALMEAALSSPSRIQASIMASTTAQCTPTYGTILSILFRSQCLLELLLHAGHRATTMGLKISTPATAPTLQVQCSAMEPTPEEPFAVLLLKLAFTCKQQNNTATMTTPTTSLEFLPITP